MRSSWADTDGLKDPKQQRQQEEQQQQQRQHPHQVSSQHVMITAGDLDVEIAEGEVLRSVQERHGLNRPSPSDTAGNWAGTDQRQGQGHHRRTSSAISEQGGKGVVQRRINRLEAAVRARQAASGHASHMLRDMIMEEETGIGAYNNISPRFRGMTLNLQGDGLMKAAAAAHHGSITPSNPYGSNYDHHFLGGQDTTMTSLDENDHRIGLFHRSNARASPKGNGKTQQEASVSIHGDASGHFGSDYIATSNDGRFVYPGYTRTSMYSTGRSNYSYPTGGYGGHHMNGKYKKKRVFPRWVREICFMCHPYRVFNNCADILVQSHFLWVGVPCLIASAICFYMLDNPRLHVLPGDTTVAVWLLFVTRQTVTLGLARLTVFVVIDGLMLGTYLAVQTLGPLITLIAATGNGWPAMMSTWALWNFVLIHGDTPFQLNWLYWTQMGLFNQNFGGILVNSVVYTRILFAAMLGGLFVSAKRTLFALRFGRKQVSQFKPRLKRILTDVVLIDEIATLAEQADKVEKKHDIEEVESDSWDMMMSPSVVQQNINDLLWVPKIEYQNSNTSEFENESTCSAGKENSNTRSDPTGKHATFADSPDKPSGEKADRPTGHAPLKRSLSGRLKIKDKLDPWVEPDTNSDKTSDISIHEILKFRRALAHLEEDNIFGEAFGPTGTRDQCISSAHSVYYRLIKLAQESDREEGNDSQVEAGVLPFDVLTLLCLGQDGTEENLIKKRKIQKLFIPDRSGGLPLLAFIQAIDQCYKRLVFLRASLRNTSLLDGVLERLFNGIFYFLLFLFLSSILQLHPWALMVSLTSILVSVSFALGSSVSAYVQGVLLIAIRRPYDLGDRIFISSADSIIPLPDVTKNSWFVEDISLATTTLRYARTNEVCTINNSSIAPTRIVNLARSPNALVKFEFAAHISILDDNRMDDFRKEMQQYVDSLPRIWESVSGLRHGMFDINEERVDISMSLRHRNSWQESGRIKNDRADVYRFLYKLGKKLDIHFTAPVDQQVVYQGGILGRGDTDDCMMRDILNGSNIRPYDSSLRNEALTPSNNI